MKILALSNSHALAHVSRQLEIAKALRRRGHDVILGGHGKYLQVAEMDGFPIRELPYVSIERVIRTIRSQKLWELYPESELVGFIEAELMLYEEVKPDLVLLDNRVTGRTSAEKAGLRTVAALNVHMSNYRRIPFFSPANLPGMANVPGLATLDRLENAVEFWVYDRLVMGGLNNIRRKLGLKRLYAYEHEEGDISLLVDLPQFNPVSHLPEHARFIGPLTWHNNLPEPACLERLQADKPTVYLSLGSDSLEELVEQLGGLASEGIQIVVATGGARIAEDVSVPDGVFLENYVNTDKLLPHCNLVCCHGGNGTLYQALFYGLPTVVVATHQEQYYGGKRIQRLGLGRTMTLKALKREGMGSLVEMVRQTLRSPDYRARAQAFSAHFKGWNSAELAADEIEKFMKAAQ
jgi:UDP:flavonoid glycosyltransferase YjiC (YdhE family)